MRGSRSKVPERAACKIYIASTPLGAARPTRGIDQEDGEIARILAAPAHTKFNLLSALRDLIRPWDLCVGVLDLVAECYESGKEDWLWAVSARGRGLLFRACRRHHLVDPPPS